MLNDAREDTEKGLITKKKEIIHQRKRKKKKNQDLRKEDRYKKDKMKVLRDNEMILGKEGKRGRTR